VPLAKNDKGEAVFLKDIWPTQQEVNDTIAASISPDMFQNQYAGATKGSAEWNAIPVKGGELFEWSDASTYIQEPPFFKDLSAEAKPIGAIRGARVLVMVGDSVTTDHISPAGSIKKDSPAGRHLIEHGVQPLDFNSYGARRGNDRVMTRGTFANIRLRNLLAPGTEGGVTTFLGPAPLPHDKVAKATSKAAEAGADPEVGKVMPIYDASMKYQALAVPLIVLAGKDYGMGSSRDWAAKGTALLGVRAVIAESYERIHRSNLVGMGVLPLQFKPGDSRETLGLDGTEVYEVRGLNDSLRPGQELMVRVRRADGTESEFGAVARVDSVVEVDYLKHGGILQMVLRNLMKK